MPYAGRMTEPTAPSTVTESLALLHDQGYTTDFEVIEGRLVGRDAGEVCAFDEVTVDRVFRFEGPSDPGDEMIVFALHDPASGIKGTLASAFGPTADPEIREHIAGLHERFG